MGMKSAYAVRTSGLSQATQVAVLEALAVFKNEQTGLCFPSTEKISLVSRVSIKYVRKSLRELEEAGLISSQQKAGGVRYFTLYLDKLPPSTVFSSEGTIVTPDDKDLPRDNCHPRDICPDTPCELSSPPRDNCPVTPVTNVTPIREEIREVNQEGTCSLSPLATSDVPLVLSADSEKSKPKAKRRKPSTPCPWESGARIPEDLDEWAAAEYPTINAGEEFKKFVGWALSKDMRYARWDQAFRNWMGNALKYQSQRGGYGSSGYRSKRQPTCPGDWEKEYKGVDYTRGAVMKEFTPEESAELERYCEEMGF